ncbi:MAG: ROK family protein [Planctomycetaceae bacterium]|nr:MAG: ROK family protein [Planctomycetaceae bacterium]
MNTQNRQPPFYVGIDVGGTNIKAGVVDDSGTPLGQSSVPTLAERGPVVGLENMVRAAHAAMGQAGLTTHDVHGIGLATPGTMDIPGGMLLDPPNLPGWNDFPIRDRLAEMAGIRTVLQNDANAAAYGEFWAGRAREARSLVFWTLGTGIGCGIIIGDLILEGAHSLAAECGHIIIEMNNGRLCGTGQYGTLEAYAGAKALVARCREALAQGKTSLVSQRLAAGGELTPLVIAECAEAGDSLCTDLVLETARYMGVGTTTVMHTINPEMVLFGGAMTFGRNERELGRRFIQEIRNEVKKRAFPIPAAKTIIDFASLGSDAGFIGAAGCARLKWGE